MLGYDLLNEPIPTFPSLYRYNSQLEPLYKKVSEEIRQVDRNHVLILGGAQWDSNFKVFGPPFDQNVMYTFHKYWMEPVTREIQPYLDFRDKYNVPIWLGESGENTDEWVGRFTRLLESNGIGWCFWPYKKMVKTSAPVSIEKPLGWDEITAFAKLPSGTGNAEKRIAGRPSLDLVRDALRDLLERIRFERCRVNPGYLQALGLRAPKQ